MHLTTYALQSRLHLQHLALHLINDLGHDALAAVTLSDQLNTVLLGAHETLLEGLDSLLITLPDLLDALLIRLSVFAKADHFVEQNRVLLVNLHTVRHVLVDFLLKELAHR